MNIFRRLCPLALAPALALLTACSHSPKQGVSRFDEYDAVKVDQMVGNNISGTVFEKVIVCLNARRETREVHAVTNTVVSTSTNFHVLAVTNQTISLATNFLFTTMTNLGSVTPAPGATPPAPGEPEAISTETNAVATITNSAPSLTTNVTFSLARNQSATAAPSQASANQQLVKTYNNQITSSSNNVTVALLTNLMVTAETNLNVSYVTNVAVASVTNVTVLPTNYLARDYFVFLEYTPPPEFSLQPGESLVLLVDGVRHGLVQTPLTSIYTPRRGFTTGFYRVAPEVLVDIANAKEVKLRLKGSTATVERSMTASSRRNFKQFLLKHFSPEDAPRTEGQMARASQPEQPTP